MKLSTRFASFRALLESRSRGLRAIAENARTDLAAPPASDSLPSIARARQSAASRRLAVFEACPWSESVDGPALLGTGARLDAGSLVRLPELRTAITKVVWRAPVDAPLAGRWVVVQHNPAE